MRMHKICMIYVPSIYKLWQFNWWPYWMFVFFLLYNQVCLRTKVLLFIQFQLLPTSILNLQISRRQWQVIPSQLTRGKTLKLFQMLHQWLRDLVTNLLRERLRTKVNIPCKFWYRFCSFFCFFYYLLVSLSLNLQSFDAAHNQESAQPSFPSDSSPNNSVGGSLQNGSSVAKCLFNQPSMLISANTSVPATPPRANSSQSDKSISPLEFFSTTSNDNTPEGVTTTRCTVISSKRVTVSPFKQIAYSLERNHCVSTSSPVKTNLKRQAKRDHVKGRLDFDGSDVNSDQPMADQISTSESEKELDLFDIDLSNLDSISFSDILRDFDFECEEMGYSCQPAIDASKDTAAGYLSCFSCCLFLWSHYFISLLQFNSLVWYSSLYGML